MIIDELGEYSRFMDSRVVEDDNRAWPRIRITKRKQIMLDKLCKNVLIDSALINVANDVTVDCEGRKKAEVGSVSCNNFRTCSVTFWGIAIVALSQF